MRKFKKRKIEKIKNLGGYFLQGFFSKKYLKRDLTILLVLIFAIFGAIFQFRKNFLEKSFSYNRERELFQVEAEIIESDAEIEKALKENEPKSVKETISKVDRTDWKVYQNSWYGIQLDYPADWKSPLGQKPLKENSWEYKYQFRMNDQKISNEENLFIGFDFTVYNIAKVKELKGTEEFPKIKISDEEASVECNEMSGHLLEIEEFPAEEVYVPIKDKCFESTMFFTNVRGNYIYNLSPIVKSNFSIEKDFSQSVRENMPEFFAVASTFELIDIVRPKPKPKITAPIPATYKLDSLGRKVCEKKNDKPSKSKKGKGKHLDMECCLDPDEYPNPHCYYPVEKYGKYLNNK